MQRKLVSKKELKTIYGVPYCPAHIARLESAGQFPKRVPLGACRVAWVADEVEAWIEVKIEPPRDCRRLFGLNYAAMDRLSMAAVAA